MTYCVIPPGETWKEVTCHLEAKTAISQSKGCVIVGILRSTSDAEDLRFGRSDIYYCLVTLPSRS